MKNLKLISILFITIILTSCHREINPTSNNNPPVFLYHYSPANEIVLLSNINYIKWVCTDYDEDTLTYDVYFGINNPPELYRNNVSTNYCDVEPLPNSTYYWKIIAKDGSEDETTSDILTFTTGNFAYNPFPVNRGIIFDSVKLTWDCDPFVAGENNTYAIYCGSDSSMSEHIIFNLTNKQYNLGTIEEGTYYWQVISRPPESSNAYPTCSQIWSFTINSSK